MSDTFIPTIADIQAGMENPKVATLNKEFLISKDALYDYYSTNSGMIAKNPSIGGAGGGDNEGEGGDDPTKLDSRVKAIEDKMDDQAIAAKESANMLSRIKSAEEIEEIEDIVNNQMILNASQENLYKAI